MTFDIREFTAYVDCDGWLCAYQCGTPIRKATAAETRESHDPSRGTEGAFTVRVHTRTLRIAKKRAINARAFEGLNL